MYFLASVFDDDYYASVWRSAVDSFPLISIPLFMVAGELMVEDYDEKTKQHLADGLKLTDRMHFIRYRMCCTIKRRTRTAEPTPYCGAANGKKCCTAVRFSVLPI